MILFVDVAQCFCISRHKMRENHSFLFEKSCRCTWCNYITQKYDTIQFTLWNRWNVAEVEHLSEGKCSWDVICISFCFDKSKQSVVIAVEAKQWGIQVKYKLIVHFRNFVLLGKWRKLSQPWLFLIVDPWHLSVTLSKHWPIDLTNCIWNVLHQHISCIRKYYIRFYSNWHQQPDTHTTCFI